MADRPYQVRTMPVLRPVHLSALAALSDGKPATTEDVVRRERLEHRDAVRALHDLYLFFGLARPTDTHHKRWKIKPAGRDILAMLGWTR